MAKRPHQYDDDNDDLEKFVKIRKKATNKKLLSELRESFEVDESKWNVSKKSNCFAARVVEVHKRYAFVSREDVKGTIDTHDVWLGTLARKFLVAKREERNLVCVGDRVLCEISQTNLEEETGLDLPRCTILNVAPRSTKISRLDPSFQGRTHVVASNVELLVIVASYKNPRLSWGLIDRFLVLAESEGIEAILVLNKKDLLAEEDSEFHDDCAKHVETLRSIGYQVLEVQANADHVARTAPAQILKKAMLGRISVFAGHSGVGKSSLVNLFRPQIVQLVEPDSDIFYKGRHTTSFASLIKLGMGGYVIDTPGIRSFAIRELGPIELSHCFRDIRPLRSHCKYRECRHVDEPDCAVVKALEEGTLAKWRYDSYLAILLGEAGREGRTRDIVVEFE